MSTAAADPRASDPRGASRPREAVGSCSTRPSPSSWTGEAGVDTLRLLFETREFGPHRFELDGWQAGSMPGAGLTWVEGHPTPGELASSEQVAAAAAHVRELVDDHFGVVKERGVSRLDSTATVDFDREGHARAFLAGMAAVPLPRVEATIRRAHGQPPHSISWTHPAGARKLARCYDKGHERGGERWARVRLEDQRRYGSGGRPAADAVAEPHYARGRFAARFGPIRKAVEGVRAATFPVIAQALADEARYGYRDVREAERLAGALVLLAGGAGGSYRRSTFYNRRAELRAAGFVVVDDLAEAVEVNLGDVVEQALESEAWGG